jgi:peptidyl-lysine (3S)-dioxygenase / protease
MKFSQFLDIIENPESETGIFYIQKQNSNLTEEFQELLGIQLYSNFIL